MKLAFSLLALTLAATAAHADPEVKLQPIWISPSELPYGSINHNAMSRSGRYVLMPHIVQNGNSNFYVRDIKTQTTTMLAPAGTGVDWNHYAISGNGQYLAFKLNSETTTRIYNQATATHQSITRQSASNMGVADNGSVLYLKSFGTYQQLLLRASSGSETVVADSRDYLPINSSQMTLSLGSLYHRDPLSRDGKTALFSHGQDYYIWRKGQGVTALAPQFALQGQNLTQVQVGNAGLSSDGQAIAFAATAPWTDADGSNYSKRYLHLLTSAQLDSCE